MRTGVRAGNHAEHKQIYDAIVANKPKEAAKNAALLMDNALAIIVAALKEGVK
jgi:DNA-binding FadR family transcriptional regulator